MTAARLCSPDPPDLALISRAGVAAARACEASTPTYFTLP